MKPNSLNTNLMLGAAFAGLSLSQLDAATVYNESINGDLSNDFSSPTDLTSTFGNFLSDSGIIGSMTTGTRGSDGTDYFFVQMIGNVSASIPFQFTADNDSGGNISMYLNASEQTSGNFLGGSGNTDFASGSGNSGTINFTTPADGLVQFQVSNETGNATMNYTIGTIPETSTAVLGLAGLAAAALRRRRQQG